MPDLLDLANCDIEEHAPSFNRLILKITTTNVCRLGNVPVDSGGINHHHNNNKHRMAATKHGLDDEPPSAPANSTWCLYNSSCSSLNSVVGVNGSDRERVLFIGFEESWERDMWSAWLTQVIISI